MPENKNEYQEAMDIFPALHSYKTDHTEINLKRLCVEISEFCNAVYSSTRSEKERAIYNDMVRKLKK